MAEAEAAAMSAPRHDVEAVGDEYAQRGAAVAFDAELVDSTERRRLEAEATDAFHPDGNGGGEAGDGSSVLTTALSAEEARFAAAPPLAGRRSPRPLAALSPPPTIHGYRATEQFYGCRAPEYLRAPPFTVGDDAGISWERPRDPLIVPRPPRRRALPLPLHLPHGSALDHRRPRPPGRHRPALVHAPRVAAGGPCSTAQGNGHSNATSWPLEAGRQLKPTRWPLNGH